MEYNEGNGKKIVVIFLIIAIFFGIGYFVFINSNLLTSSDLKDKASSVGNQFYNQYIQPVKIEEIYGYSNPEKSHIEYLALSIHFYTESEEINFKNCTITVEYDGRITLIFKELYVYSYTPIFNNQFIDNSPSLNFGVISTTDSDNSIINRFGLTYQDKAIILINLSSIIKDTGLPLGESMSGEFIIDNSYKIEYFFTVPRILENRVVPLI